MTPVELCRAAAEIGQRWPDALIYANPPAAPNGWVQHPDIPVGALCVDVDGLWPHECEDDDDCAWCVSGFYALVAWIDIMGVVHYVDNPGVER